MVQYHTQDARLVGDLTPLAEMLILQPPQVKSAIESWFMPIKSWIFKAKDCIITFPFIFEIQPYEIITHE